MRGSAVLLTCLLAACGDAAAPPDSPGGGDPPLGPSSSVGGCQIFPGDNAWNRDVSADPVAANSDALLSVMVPGNALHLDLGTTEEYYGIPCTVVPAGQLMVTIEFGTDGADYSDESDPGPMPIPRDAPIEGGSSADPNPSAGDRHVLVVQQGDCVLYELYNAVRTTAGFRVSSSARWDLTVNATRPPGGPRPTRPGCPSSPACSSTTRWRPAASPTPSGSTDPGVRRAYVAPASHCGQYADATSPPYGTRVRLRADFALDRYGGDALVTHRAQDVRPDAGRPGERLVRDRASDPAGKRPRPASRRIRSTAATSRCSRAERSSSVHRSASHRPGRAPPVRRVHAHPHPPRPVIVRRCVSSSARW